MSKNEYGAVNGIWQNPFERWDCHVVWYAFIFGIWQIQTNVKLLISLRKINHVLRFDDLTNFNCSPFLEFDTFGAIMARILSNSENDEPKWLAWWFFCSTFWRFDKFRAKIAPNVSNSKNGEQLKFVKSSKRSTWLIFRREINNLTLVRICQIPKTNAYQTTWQSHLSNRFCQIPLTAPYLESIRDPHTFDRSDLVSWIPGSEQDSWYGFKLCLQMSLSEGYWIRSIESSF